MKIHFSKYQATGNDFVLIDNRSGAYTLSTLQIQAICNRRFGVGADGLMLIEQHPTAHFTLRYYNSDGSQSLCGNGSRAAVKMAASLGVANGKTRFEAFDGIHEAELLDGDVVRLKMNDVTHVKKVGDDYFINTGSPHHLQFVSNLQNYPVVEAGRKIRYSDAYSPGGTNVNFVEPAEGNSIVVRTYERGVEDETLSCGTGVTAAAIAASYHGRTSPVTVHTRGGDLQVEFKARPSGQASGHIDLPNGQAGIFEEIFLIGPAKLVFEGVLEL